MLKLIRESGEVQLAKVLEIHRFSPNVFELRIERGEEIFRPGDCSLLIEKDGITARPYSISSSPEDDFLGFLVRRIPGGTLTGFLSELKPGDSVETSPFFGWFYPGSHRKEVHFATGTGISPFWSSARNPGSPHPLATFYGVAQKEDAAGLEDLKGRGPLHLAVSRENLPGIHHGRITDLLDKIPLENDIHYMLCGHEPMINQIRSYLQRNLIFEGNIHYEVFFTG